MKFPLAFFLKVYYTMGATFAGVMELVDVVDPKPLLRTRALPVADEARVEQVQRSARTSLLCQAKFAQGTANDGDISRP